MLYEGLQDADAGPVNPINKIIYNKNWDWCWENFASLQEFQHKSIHDVFLNSFEGFHELADDHGSMNVLQNVVKRLERKR